MANSRFTVLPVPMAAPGKCGCCGTPAQEGRTFLDTSLDFEFYGALIFCNECVSEMARQFGWCEPGQIEAALAKIEAQETELIALRARLQHTEAYIASVFNVDPASGVLSSHSVISEPVSVVPEGTSETSSGEGSGDSEADESSNESGPDDLRDPDLPRFSANPLSL